MPQFMVHDLAAGHLEVLHDFLLVLIFGVFGDLISQGRLLVERRTEDGIVVGIGCPVTLPGIRLYAIRTLLDRIVAVPVDVPPQTADDCRTILQDEQNYRQLVFDSRIYQESKCSHRSSSSPATACAGCYTRSRPRVLSVQLEAFLRRSRHP